MAKIVKTEGSNKVWVIRFKESDNGLDAYSVYRTRREARAHKKSQRWSIDNGCAKVTIHKGLQCQNSGQLYFITRDVYY